jgi:hypothetical protein
LDNTRKQYNSRKVTVGAVKQSMAAIGPAWLFRKVRPACHGG